MEYLYKRVALARDIAERGLKAGDVATVVEKLPATAESGGEPGLVLEFFNAIGETEAVVVLPESAVQPLAANEILHIRRLARAV